MNYLYALHDTAKGGMFKIEQNEAISLNRQGYGIHHNCQVYKSHVRKLSEVIAIRTFAIDIDSKQMPKEKMREVIKKAIRPSTIVETKNGYHVYYNLIESDWLLSKDQNIIKEYRELMDRRFIPFFNADEQSSLANKTLRMPGFYHLKDIETPYLVKKVYDSNIKYRLNELLDFFKILKFPLDKPTNIVYNNKHDKGIKEIKSMITMARLMEVLGYDPENTRTQMIRCKSDSHKGGDKTPSLCVYHDSNTFHCFGCGARGDIFNFYKLNFKEEGFAKSLNFMKGLV